MRLIRMLISRSLLLAVFALVLVGCSSYIPPGAKADLQAFAPHSIQAGFEAKPTSPFPASVAAVRVQAGGYANYYVKQNGGVAGSGRYSIVLVREVEQEAQFEVIQKLPQVAGIVTLNRLLVPDRLNDDKDIREAAARLQADLVFLYTFATEFFDINESRALTSITLGFGSTKKINVITTASALLMDTRTGYIYSAYESTSKADAKSNVWDSAESADVLRRETEKEAFAKLVGEVAKSWPRMLERHRK
jgi:hypothetical protein